MAENIFKQYDGISRYAGVPTDQKTGRLHYNENLYGPSPKLFDTLKDLTLEDICLYETTDHDDLIDAISEEIGVPADNIFLQNGSAENIKSIVSIVTEHGDTILLPDPGWSYYTGLCDYKFINIVRYPILEGATKCAHDVEAIKKLARELKPRMIFITTPAMPTGNKMSDEDIESIVREFPESIVLIDEAYYGLAPYTLDVRRLVETYDNIVFSRTFSKFYALANLRLGYGIASTKLKSVLFLDLPLHRPSRICKRMAVAALKDTEYYTRVTKKLIDSREHFISVLNELPGVLAYESDANFVYIRAVGYDVEKVKAIVANKGYMIRIFTSNNEKHLRITVGTTDIMKDFEPILIQAMKDSAI